MAQASEEKWELHCGKKIHIISGAERQFILDNHQKKFVSLRGVDINPSFVSQIIFLSNDSPRLPAPDESDLPTDEWVQRHAKK